MIVTQFDQLDLAGTYSYADYLKWQLDERIELIKGKIFKMSPAPAPRHQLISGEISFLLKKFLKKSPCKVFAAPFDVRLTPLGKVDNQRIHTVVQPDICVVCAPEKIDSKGCLGAPDLVIEILSPGNTDREMNEKFQIYQENGVLEYWLVEPNDRIVLVYVLNESGQFIGLKPFTESETITSKAVEGFEVLVRDIFDV
jgi:Uma2 family endonuclease